MAPPHLRTVRTRLIGRYDEINAIAGLVARDDVAVVTITGPGGAGKTRLAREMAQALRDAFPDGVVYVDLAPLTAVTMVECQIAQELHVAESPNVPLMDLVRRHLRERALLLVLDQFEHVLDAAPEIERMVAECPGLKVLTTSRAPLGIPSERQFPISLMPVPPGADPWLDDERDRVRRIESYGAVELFCDRAQAVNPGFRLTADNALVVAEICRRLDGLPLALELAATWTKLLSPEQLRDRLDQRLTLLTGSTRGLPGRHQTLRDAIGWSYDLLGEEERAVFRRLSVFAGGATLDSVAAVSAPLALSPDALLRVVANLVNQSLVVAGPDSGGTTRIRLLETIRDFAHEKLEAHEDPLMPARAMVDHMVALAEEAAPHLVTQDRRRWLRRLSEEEDNLRAALRICLQQDWSEPAMRILSATFWSEVNHAREASSWLESVLQRPSAHERTLARAGALHTAALFRWQQGDFAGLGVYAEEAIAITREQGDKALLAIVIAASACAQTTAAGRQARIDAGLASAEASGQRWVLEWCYRSAASIAQWFREPERSIEMATAGIAIGDPQNTWHRARLQAIRGQARMQLGDFALARNELRAAIAGFRETQETWTLLPALLHFAIAAAIEQEWTEATASFVEAARRALAGSEMQSLAHAAAGLGVCLAEAGEIEAAREAFAAHAAAVALPGFPLTIPEEWAELLARSRKALGMSDTLPITGSFTQAIKRCMDVAETAHTRSTELPARGAANPAGLSQREIEVLKLIALGKSNKQIGDELFLSVRTVEKHVANIYGKAAISGRAEATLLATRMGLVV